MMPETIAIRQTKPQVNQHRQLSYRCDEENVDKQTDRWTAFQLYDGGA